MIAEAIILSGVLVGSVCYKISKDSRGKREIISKWNKLMSSMEKSENSEEKYKIINVVILENKVIFDVEIMSGSSFNSLACKKNEIENAFQGVCIMEQVKFSNRAKVTIITRNIMDFMFEPVSTKPNELYVGKKMSGENHIIDVTKACHILIGGATGGGKSFLLAAILCNLIYNSSSEIEIHLLQIMKADLAIFENCKGVKFTATKLEEVVLDLEKIHKILISRNNILRETGCKNLEHYNKFNSKNKFKRIYIVIEEISFFMATEDDVEEIKVLKNKVWNYLKTIIISGRAPGIHVISVTQRSTVSNLPSDLKSNMCRISLKQFSSIDSRNLIETDDAINLGDKECICYADGNFQQIIKIPNVDEDFKILHHYVQEIKLPGKRITKPKPEYKDNKNNIKIDTTITNKKERKRRKGVILDADC